MVDDPEAGLLADVVLGNRILARHGVVDAFGHLSARGAIDPARYHISRSIAPALVERGDLMEFDLESEPCTSYPYNSYVERFIHGEIYKVRHDVGAIVHCHSPVLVAFAAVQRGLEPIYHMAGCLGEGCGRFEIRDVEPDSPDMLVRSRKTGAALAQSLGSSAIVLMRGHGATIVGPTVQIAVFRAIFIQANASIAAAAMQMGEPRYLSLVEAQDAQSTVEQTAARAWELWSSEVGPDCRRDDPLSRVTSDG